MKRTLGLLGWALLASLVIGTVLAVAAVSMAGGMDAATIRINGEPISTDHLDFGQSLLTVGGVASALLIAVLIAMLIAVLTVPLAVLITLATVAVVLIGAVLLLAGVLAMLCSPLIFAGLVIWLMSGLIRRGNARSQVARGATITG